MAMAAMWYYQLILRDLKSMGYKPFVVGLMAAMATVGGYKSYI